MEYGQQMKDSRENAITSFYQNPGYQLERRNRKTFILKVLSDGTIHFNETLQEPLIIDRLSDIYLESFLTFHANTNDNNGLNLDSATNLSDRSAFVLKINEFNNQGNSSEANTFNKIVIPHVIEADKTNYRKNHKSRKLNYICSTNPTTLSSLTGTISGLDGTKNLFVRTGSGLGSNPFVSDMFLAEFVIIARD